MEPGAEVTARTEAPHRPPKHEISVAILGAGILGSCTALELADRGFRVSLFERNAEPMCEASRFNEGKLHLGFVYAADPTFRTAERMISGSADFVKILSRWISRESLRAMRSRPFDYLVHRDSMVPPAAIESHFARVAEGLSASPTFASGDSPLDRSRPAWRRLNREQLAARYNPAEIDAAYETCEIALDSWAVADHLRAAVQRHPRIRLVAHARVISALDRAGGGLDVRFERDGLQRAGPFDVVVNALWANRPAVDRRFGLAVARPAIVRHKLGVNLRHGHRVGGLPSFTIVLGPFGDMVDYGNGRVFLSWYPACLTGSTTDVRETDWRSILDSADTATVHRDTIAALVRICPAVRGLEPIGGSDVVVNGGAIFATGETGIEDPESQLHTRLDFGFEGRETYLSVDTAKYSLGPATAIRAANRACEIVGASGH